MQTATIVIDSLSRLKKIATAGFAVGLHLRFTSAAYMFECYPPEFRELYARQGWLMRDPTVRWSMQEQGVKRWPEFEATDDTGLLALAREYGLTFGHSHSIHEGANFSLGGFSRSDRDFTDAEIEEVGQLLRRLHDATRSRAPLGAEAHERIRDMAIVATEQLDKPG
ncbi:MAG: autoinducer binding domain-containing protein [Limimaricola soesokkakensis]|uniref:autoinducer binding domain-containing protein n=1 Tax=Limimaricola soesokkakensis TaxID=1343159 RepID=UPI0040587EFF